MSQHFHQVQPLDNVFLALADRFRAWREANAAQLQGAPTPSREEYAETLRRVHKESPVHLDWARFLAMPEAEFLAEFSGILRHVNEDGTLRRGYRPGFVS